MKNDYPDCLAQSLHRLGKEPTGDIEWDRAVLAMLQAKDRARREPWEQLHKVAVRVHQEQDRMRASAAELEDPAVYRAHANFLLYIANSVVLAPQRRQFILDDDNKDIVRFLLYYFNDCPLCEDVFPDRGYKLHKNILLQGGVGVGKTMLMQIFSEYLRRTNNPRYFINVSVTQMVNYFSIHNNIDKYTYNEENSRGFKIDPVHICLNDIGLDNRPFYGIDTNTVVCDFLHARNEIWTNESLERRFAHLTTNLDNNKLREKFRQKDDYGRVIDRFKTYNIIPMTGSSRR